MIDAAGARLAGTGAASIRGGGQLAREVVETAGAVSTRGAGTNGAGVIWIVIGTETVALVVVVVVVTNCRTMITPRRLTITRNRGDIRRGT